MNLLKRYHYLNKQNVNCRVADYKRVHQVLEVVEKALAACDDDVDGTKEQVTDLLRAAFPYFGDANNEAAWVIEEAHFWHRTSFSSV